MGDYSHDETGISAIDDLLAKLWYPSPSNPGHDIRSFETKVNDQQILNEIAQQISKHPTAEITWFKIFHVNYIGPHNCVGGYSECSYACLVPSPKECVGEYIRVVKSCVKRDKDTEDYDQAALLRKLHHELYPRIETLPQTFKDEIRDFLNRVPDR